MADEGEDNRVGGEDNRVPEKTPDDKLQKIVHTTAWRLKPKSRLEPVL